MTFIHDLAEGCMPFLHFLQGIRNPILDGFFSLVTHLGEETFFLAFAILFFWCINKREGYYILITGLVGTLVNQLAKLFFRVPRPWDLDKSFEIVEDARKEATGYSFPSGHTQNIAGTYGAIAAFNPKVWKTVLCTTIVVLVAFSRMYLGVHTPLDVIVSLLLALAMILLLRPLFVDEDRFKRSMPWIVIFSTILSVGFLAYVLSVSGDAGLDSDNFNSALKNAYTLLGALLGMAVALPIERKYINFETKDKWYIQIIKTVLGLAIVLGVKEISKALLKPIFGNNQGIQAVRYFAVVMVAVCAYPLLFPIFRKIDEKIIARCKSRKAVSDNSTEN